MAVSGSGGARRRRMCCASPARFLRQLGHVQGEEPRFIEDCFLSAAVKLVRDYFWPHSRAALRQIGLSERHANARRVLRWIAAQNLAEVSIQGIRRDALAQSLDAEQTPDLLENLEIAGWLRKKTTKTRVERGIGGKSTQSFSLSGMQKVQKVQKTESATSKTKCGGVSAIAALPAGLVVRQPRLLATPSSSRRIMALPPERRPITA